MALEITGTEFAGTDDGGWWRMRIRGTDPAAVPSELELVAQSDAEGWTCPGLPGRFPTLDSLRQALVAAGPRDGT